MRAPDKPGISNLIEILAVARGVAPEQIEREFEGAGLRRLQEGASPRTWSSCWRPVRERYAELRPDEAALERDLAEGAERARERSPSR